MPAIIVSLIFWLVVVFVGEVLVAAWEVLKIVWPLLVGVVIIAGLFLLAWPVPSSAGMSNFTSGSEEIEMQDEGIDVESGLIIAEPWISMILSGQKVWEMRSQHTKKRERIALIKKGSGHIVGFAELYDSVGPLDQHEIKDSIRYHHVPDEMVMDTDYKWVYAWKLRAVKVLQTPIAYRHKSGAVVWVALS